MAKHEMKTIGGKQYDYVFCPRCEVWIQAEVFDDETGEHSTCDEHFASLESRRRAEGKLSKVFSEMFK